MKIAVLLFGHLRDFEQCATSLKMNLLDIYDSDLFIHTWDETEPSTDSWHKMRTRKKDVDSKMIEKLYRLYPIKELEVEHQEKYKNEVYIRPETNKDITISNSGMHFMFDTMSKANELRKRYQKKFHRDYDYVVVTRPDVKLKRPLSIENVVSQANRLGLDLDECRFFGTLPVTSTYGASLYLNTPNDILFFAKPSIIDRYISANRDLSTSFVEKHYINIVSIYTAKEIEIGIKPIPITYTMGVDWSFSRARVKSTNLKSVKGLMAKFLVWITRPVFYFYQKYEWLNYYN